MKLRGDLGELFQPNALKLEVSIAGKTRTVDMTDPGSLIAYHDVTKEVSPLDQNGHPAWYKIREEARKLARDLRRTVQNLGVSESRPLAATPTVPPRPVIAGEPQIARKAG